MSDGSNFSELGATRMQRVNQVCNRFEAAWRSGSRPSLAEHLSAAPPPEQPVLARMLIELDLDYRRMQGETPQASDYRPLLSFEATWLEPLVRGAFDATRIEEPGAKETSGQFSLSLRSAAGGAEVLPRVLGDYLLLERIGGGGMGVVYKAEHQHMRRIVALKLIRPDEAHGLAAQQRFKREVEAAARLHHPYIVTAFDARVEQGTWCLITEFVAGKDLARVVQESGPLSLQQALHCISQAAEALQYAHGQGVVHRDIKPANLLLDNAGNVKVLDMGLARLNSLETDSAATRANARLTQTGYVVGTVDFMSPEQAQNSANADARSDIYSLGCTLYYLLAGEAAYRGTTVMETLLAHREQPIPALSSIRTDIPPELEHVFERMLAKQPTDRYQSMGEVLVALQQVANSPGTLSNSTAVPPKLIDRQTARSAKSPFPLPWSWSAGASVLFACLLLGVIFWWRSDRSAASLDKAEQIRERTVDPASVATLPTLTAAGAVAAQAAAAAALHVPIEISNDLGMNLRLIPAQRLQVGERLLAAPEPFYLQTTEVTVAQFRKFVAATEHVTEAEASSGWGMRDARWRLEPGFNWKNLGSHPQSDDLPVVNISWNDAQAFCTWLNSLPNADGTYRLPSEDEWELACRAGSKETWYFGESRNRLGEVAWYDGNSGNHLQPVAQKSTNPFGCHDLLGNECEWCADLFSPGGTDRVQRGGSFSHPAELVTCANRWSEAPGSPSHGAFRVVRNVSP